MRTKEPEFDSSDSGDEYIDSSGSESGSDESGGSPEPPERPFVEKEIDGDFDRLVQNIRNRNDEPGLSKDWDFNIEDQEAEFRDDLRAASGIGRRARRKGRATGPVLSQQVRSLIGDGNQAYIDSNIQEAIRIMFEVIRIEPRAPAPWTVLAQCFSDMKNEGKALQLRIMAAHLSHDADEWDRLARQSRDLGYNQQALYCFRKAYNLDPNNIEALWERAVLAKEIGDLRNAKLAYSAILKRFPHDLSILSELRAILIELGDFATCASLFQQAFHHYREVYPSGSGPAPSSSEEIPGGGFALMEILVLADLYNTLNEYESAIDVIRKGCRWLQGRGEQRYWDVCEDDREYDDPEMNIPRPVGGSITPGGYTLDINARHRLAIARIKMGDIEESQIHTGIILREDVLDYAALFVEIADAYFERELYADAKPIYELLGSDANTSSVYILMQTAACFRMLDELREAVEVYEHIRVVDPTNNEAKMKLAEIYEIMGEARKALALVYEVIDSRKKKPKGKNSNMGDEGNAAGSLFSEDKPPPRTKSGLVKPQNRLTPAQIRQLEAEKEAEVIRGYKRMKEIWAKMLEDDAVAAREWMIEAEKMIETFRETRNLFMTGRNTPFRGMFPRSRKRKASENAEAAEDRMASRLHLDLENDSQSRRGKGARIDKVDVFRGVSFSEWLRIFMTYCFNLTRNGQYDLADEVLRHIMLSSAYQSPEVQVNIRLALLSCAIYAQRYGIVVEQCRKVINMHQFNNEPIRLLVASLASGLLPTDAFITSTLQKHLFRELKLGDTAVRNPDALKYNAVSRRYAPTSTSKADDDDDMDEDGADDQNNDKGKAAVPPLPTQQNPIMVAIYGQVCIAAKSYQSAIFYLLHAYDYCPEDPMICLSLAIASIGRAMQRQSDNRHHLVAQAMAFLSRYRAIRSVDEKRLSEVEFNFGRTFHQLGLLTYASKHYERVLAIENRKVDFDPSESFAKEAAYNLSLIYMSTRATPLVEKLYERWLSI